MIGGSSLCREATKGQYMGQNSILSTHVLVIQGKCPLDGGAI